MRDLTKAMLSFGWVMPLYGLQQMANLVQPKEWTEPGRATDALDTVSSAAREQLGDTLKQAFDAGDRMQKSTVDLLFGAVGSRSGRPSSPGGGATEAEHAGGEHVGEEPAQGWGPVPSGR